MAEPPEQFETVSSSTSYPARSIHALLILLHAYEKKSLGYLVQGGTSIVDWAETNDWANANDRVEQAELASAAEDSARLLEAQQQRSVQEEAQGRGDTLQKLGRMSELR